MPRHMWDTVKDVSTTVTNTSIYFMLHTNKQWTRWVVECKKEFSVNSPLRWVHTNFFSTLSSKNTNTFLNAMLTGGSTSGIRLVHTEWVFAFKNYEAQGITILLKQQHKKYSTKSRHILKSWATFNLSAPSSAGNMGQKWKKYSGMQKCLLCKRPLLYIPTSLLLQFDKRTQRLFFKCCIHQWLFAL